MTVNEDVWFFQKHVFLCKEIKLQSVFRPQSTGEFLSLAAMDTFLRSVQPEVNDLFVFSLVLINLLAWMDLFITQVTVSVFLSCRGERGQKASTLYFVFLLYIYYVLLEVYLFVRYIHLTALMLLATVTLAQPNYTCCLCCFIDLHRNRKFLPEMHQLSFSFFFLPILLLLLSSLSFFLQMISDSIHNQLFFNPQCYFHNKINYSALQFSPHCIELQFFSHWNK